MWTSLYWSSQYWASEYWVEQTVAPVPSADTGHGDPLLAYLRRPIKGRGVMRANPARMRGVGTVHEPADEFDRMKFLQAMVNADGDVAQAFMSVFGD